MRLPIKLSIRVAGVLMVVTIAVITAFQVYWLVRNYREEEQLFTTHSSLLFRETIYRLEASKLKLDSNVKVRIGMPLSVIGVSRQLQQKVQQTMVTDQGPGNKLMVISIKDSSVGPHDSLKMRYKTVDGRPGKVIDFLAGVDSLRNPITAEEIADRYRQELDAEHIHLPFTVRMLHRALPVHNDELLPDNPLSNIVTVGFTKPVSYELAFSNKTWYLLKRIAQPILVSFCLLGVTFLSFLMLYSNLRQQRRLSQLKNDFISNITHELKTPIATVGVAIEALRNFNALEDAQRTQEYLEISAGELQRLSLLVDKVLKLSMFESREIALNKEQFDLTKLTREVTASMRLQAEKQHASVHIDTTGSNFIITADRLHMTSVMYNLIDNALKYSKGDPHIDIQITDHNSYIEWCISDNGIGIPREYKRKIFEKFFRVPGGNRHNTKGYGLGLSYVSHIVQRHLGFIEVESELNRGSTFRVSLPFAEAPVIDYGRGRMVKRKLL